MTEPRKVDRPKRPSMYDVARAAGVSQTTVSFVVNNVPTSNIPQETRERVMAAVARLGWRPNAMARGLSQRSSQTIGLISDEVATSPHAGKIIQGAQDAAWAHGKMLLVINTGSNAALEHAALEMLLERQVDGIIYATMYHRPVIAEPALSQVPTVLLDCYAEDRALPSVVPDEVQGGQAATSALIERGHRRIGFINSNEHVPATAGRLAGYQAALAANKLPFDPGLVRTGESTAAEGYRCALELMALRKRPTALFCFNDTVAMGVYDAIRKLGLDIPRDVAVVGFDNHELIAAQLHPPLTSMELPHYAMGQWAVNYLLGQSESDTQPAIVQQTLPCRFVERASI